MRKYNPTKSKVFIDETGKVSFMYQQEGAREDDVAPQMLGTDNARWKIK